MNNHLPHNKNLRKLNLSNVRKDPSELLNLGELGLIIFNKDTAVSMLDWVLSHESVEDRRKALSIPVREADFVVGAYAGTPRAIMEEVEFQKTNGAHTLSIFSCVQDDIKTLRPITYEDFTEDGMRLRFNEAAIIVVDLVLGAQSKKDPEINPIVSAYAGHDSLILAEKAKYENNPRYEIMFTPSEKSFN